MCDHEQAKVFPVPGGPYNKDTTEHCDTETFKEFGCFDGELNMISRTCFSNHQSYRT
jgi:hypothetical protein